MPRLTKIERELQDTRQALAGANQGLISWRERCEKAEKLVAEKDRAIALWNQSAIDNQRDVRNLRDEIDRHKATIGDLHARIGRMCLKNGVCP